MNSDIVLGLVSELLKLAMVLSLPLLAAILNDVALDPQPRASRYQETLRYEHFDAQVAVHGAAGAGQR